MLLRVARFLHHATAPSTVPVADRDEAFGSAAAKKAISTSSKAGLQFPVGRINGVLKVGKYAERVGTDVRTPSTSPPCSSISLPSSDKHCPKLMEFLYSRGIYFASVNISNDKIKMSRTCTWGIEIPAEYHNDFQSKFRLKYDKTSMADMAAALIDEDHYADMKIKFPKSHHKLWKKTPLDPINIEYAAIDGYVAYELYRKI